MESQDILNKEIGDKEIETLKAVPVTVGGVTVNDVTNRVDKLVGKKVTFICKHPDREDTLNLSKVVYIKGKQVAYSGTWYNEDDEGKIQKGSALAITMNFYNVKALKEFIGKELKTDFDEQKYLCIKAY